MPSDFEQMLKEIFDESVNRISGFQHEQMSRLVSKLQEIAREAVKDDLARLHTELGELRARVGVLEAERAEAAGEIVEGPG
jgi:hypothetical protein